MKPKKLFAWLICALVLLGAQESYTQAFPNPFNNGGGSSGGGPSTIPVPVAQGGTGQTSNPSSGLQAGVPSCLGYASVAACEASYQASFPLLHNTDCQNDADDSIAINAALTASVTGGWKRVVMPGQGYECLQLTQINIPANGITIMGQPQNVAYNGNTVNGSIWHVNSGYVAGWTAANNAAINLNGHSDLYVSYINFLGDGAAYGTAGIVDSFNTVTSNEPQPRVWTDNVSFSQMGAGIGCSLTTTGNTGLASCFSGTGGTGSNLLTSFNHHLVCNEGGVCAAGNITDFHMDDTSVIAGMSCGGIVGTVVGTTDMDIRAARVENGGAGTSGVCGANNPAIEVTGPDWTIMSQLRLNSGPALLFDGQYANDTFTGSLVGDGSAGSSGAESEIVFNTSSGSHPGVSIVNTAFGQPGITAPKYAIEALGTTDTSPIILKGGIADSTNGYTSAFVNNSTETLVLDIDTLGQPANFASRSLIAGVSTPTISTATFTANAALANTFNINLVNASCPCTLANPTNPVDGQRILFRIKQSTTGSDLINTYGAAFDFGAAGAPTLTTTASKTDALAFEYDGVSSKWNYLGSALGF